MNTLSLRDFKRICRLSDTDLISLLERGELPMCLSENGTIEIEIEKVDQRLIAQRPPLAIEESHEALIDRPLLEEIIGAETSRALDGMLDEVFAIVEQRLRSKARS